MKARTLVLDGYGQNCGYETDFALRLAGAESERVHINELLWREKKLEDYHILFLGGGFSFGDDHGAGLLEACKLKYNLGEGIQRFIREGKLIMGICNGAQAVVNMGLLPGFDGNYDSQELALISNDCANYRDDWVRLKVNEASPCIFTRCMKEIELPIRHGEGKFYAEKPVIRKLFERNQVVLQYARIDGSGKIAGGKFPDNPNGSLYDIAGICDSSGRVFILMPHPEAYNSFTNHPHWTRKKESYKRKGLPIPEIGDGIQIFRNAVEYAENKLV